MAKHGAAGMPDDPPGPRWTLRDVAACFPPSARLPLLAERAARPSATAGHHKALARTLLELGRLEEAWTALAPALAGPIDPDTRLLAGTIARASGRMGEAIAHLRHAVADDSASVPAVDGLARALDRVRRRDEALAVLADGLRRAPGNADLWATLTGTAVAGGRAAALERAFAELVLPEHPIGGITDARVFLAERGGDRATLERLLLAPGLVSETDLLPPDDPLLDAVLAEVAAVDDFVANPYDRSVAGGRQAPFPVTADRPAWAALVRRIRDRVEAHFAALRRADPGFAPPGGGIRLRSWAVRLADGGRQRVHLHPTGWFSGVVYLAVPPEVAAADDGAGCLEIPVLPGGLIPDWPVRRIRPAPGRLVLFPSYLRHGTVPFRSAGERVCIAFDLLPEDGVADCGTCRAGYAGSG